MTKEDKELLLRYLCMALPYEIVVDYSYNALEMRKGRCTSYIKQDTESLLDCDLLDIFMSPRQNENGEYIKPYLRSMSSMTQAEKKHLNDLRNIKFDTYYGYHAACINYLNSIHVDYNDLIGKGLAIEVTEENNPYK